MWLFDTRQSGCLNTLLSLRNPPRALEQSRGQQVNGQVGEFNSFAVSENLDGQRMSWAKGRSLLERNRAETLRENPLIAIRNVPDHLSRVYVRSSSRHAIL